jgi:glutathione S-transferase
MKLLGNPRSPYVKKVVIALKEKGVPYDYLEVSAGDPAGAAPTRSPKSPRSFATTAERCLIPQLSPNTLMA